MTDSLTLSAVIVLAAGKGTRVGSHTPKVLLEMCGRTLVGHVNDAISDLHPRHTVFVVRHERERVVRHLRSINPQALIADQDEIKGTGRAAWCGLRSLPQDLTGPVLVIAADSPMFTPDTLRRLLRAHWAAGAERPNAVTVLSVRLDNPFGYGRILRRPGSSAGIADGPICGVVEEKDATEEQRRITEVNTSTYIFDADFLRSELSSLGTDNAQGEVYLTDMVAAAADSGKPIGSYVLTDSVQAEGVNDLVQLARLRKVKNMRILQGLMRSGVSVTDPDSTYVDVDVTVGADAVIEPGTVLRGGSEIAPYATVGPNTQLINAKIGAYASVPQCFVENAEVMPHEHLPAFTVRKG